MELADPGTAQPFSTAHFNAQQLKIESFAANTLRPSVSDLDALLALGGNTGLIAVVREGGALFQRVGSTWVQQTEARFASATERDAAYAKAGGVYRVAGVARVRLTGRNYTLAYTGTPAAGAWVAEIAMVQIRPDSASGTGSVTLDSGGSVVLAAAGDTSVITSLPADFDHHRIEFSLHGDVTGIGVYLRLLVNSTIKSDNLYTYRGVQNISTAGVSSWADTTSYMYLGNMGGSPLQAIVGHVDIYDAANAAKYTRVHWETFAYDGNDNRYVSAAGNYAVTEANNGFQILRNKAATFTGYIRVYGIGKGA